MYINIKLSCLLIIKNIRITTIRLIASLVTFSPHILYLVVVMQVSNTEIQLHKARMCDIRGNQEEALAM